MVVAGSDSEATKPLLSAPEINTVECKPLEHPSQFCRSTNLRRVFKWFALICMYSLSEHTCTGCPKKNYTLFWRAVAPLNFELGIKVGGVLESSGSWL